MWKINFDGGIKDDDIDSILELNRNLEEPREDITILKKSRTWQVSSMNDGKATTNGDKWGDIVR